jgi:hypothetical protein
MLSALTPRCTCVDLGAARLITAFGCKATSFERIDAFGDAIASALRD